MPEWPPPVVYDGPRSVGGVQDYVGSGQSAVGVVDTVAMGNANLVQEGQNKTAAEEESIKGE